MSLATTLAAGTQQPNPLVPDVAEMVIGIFAFLVAIPFFLLWQLSLYVDVVLVHGRRITATREATRRAHDLLNESLDTYIADLTILANGQNLQRLAAGDLSARHAVEELCADDFLDCREARRERLHEPGYHIVAMNGKAPARVDASGCAKAGRGRLLGIKQGVGEHRLERHGRSYGHAADARGNPARAAVRRRSAVSASSRRIGQSGTSLSHSISVGTGPVRARTYS